MSTAAPRVALVHDWLTGMRGGEKVLEAFCELFPAADVFALVHNRGSVSPAIERHPIRTSYLDRFPAVDRRYRYYLPFMPRAIESLDLSAYDLVISTSHCVAKSCKPRPDAIHICYCFTPMRYIWDQFDHYFGPGQAKLPVRWAMRLLRGPLQRWDRDSASRASDFIADSAYVRERIRNYYNREAAVIYPPVDTDFYNPAEEEDSREEPYYLVVSAFAPYKRVDVAVEAFNRLGLRLVIIGSGQREESLKALAKPNIEFLGWKPDEDLRRYYRRCRALIFPGVEDFGIVPVEVQACGRPVIALREGGALETVAENLGGLFFDRQTPEALEEAVRRFEARSWDPAAIREHALGFRPERFRSQIMDFIAKKMKQENLPWP